MNNDNLKIFYDESWYDIDDVISFEVTYKTIYDCISPFHHLPGNIDKVAVKLKNETVFDFTLFHIIDIGPLHEICKYYSFIIDNLAHIYKVTPEIITQCCRIK